MTLEELAKMVRSMRDRQKGYLLTKTGLDACKASERRVDEAVEEILSPQRGLFDAPPCDHAWVASLDGGWQCTKCHDMTDIPPRGTAGVAEKPPPNSQS